MVQELAVREGRGERVDLEGGAPDSSAGHTKDQIKGIMARASRLVQRKVLRQAGSGRIRHKGFVPPYNTQSRVFDANELRDAATQVGSLLAGAAQDRKCLQNGPDKSGVTGSTRCHQPSLRWWLTCSHAKSALAVHGSVAWHHGGH